MLLSTGGEETRGTQIVADGNSEPYQGHLDNIALGAYQMRGQKALSKEEIGHLNNCKKCSDDLNNYPIGSD